MTIDYTIKGKVKISMFEYIDILLTEMPSDINGVSKLAAATHLFDLDYKAEKLEEAKVQFFHQLVAKIIYKSWGTKQDI